MAFPLECVWRGGSWSQNKPEGDQLPWPEKAAAEEAEGGGLSSCWFFFSGGIQCDEFSARARAIL